MANNGGATCDTNVRSFAKFAHVYGVYGVGILRSILGIQQCPVYWISGGTLPFLQYIDALRSSMFFEIGGSDNSLLFSESLHLGCPPVSLILSSPLHVSRTNEMFSCFRESLSI